MGSGKTQAMYRVIRENPDKSYMFVTPYLNTIQDAIDSGLDIRQPEYKGGSKADSLKYLLSHGYNIGCTHSLFLDADDDLLDIIQNGGYTLFIDEALDVIKPVNDLIDDVGHRVKKGTAKFLIQQGIIKVDDHGKVIWCGEHVGDDYEYAYLEPLVKSGNVLCIDNQLFLWMFPPKIFSVFERVIILSYLFKGSVFDAYLKIHGLDYEMGGVSGNYEEQLIAIIKRFSEIVHVTQRYGYGRDAREPWRVQLGISLDRYHAEQATCKRNYLKYKRALQGFAEVLRVSHGNAPRNEGRAKALPNATDFENIVSTYMLQQIEMLSSDYKPMCKFYNSYYLSRPDQKVVCCGIYVNADGQVLPGFAADTDFFHRGVTICNSWEPIWEKIVEYNRAHERHHCTFCDDIRTKINIMRPGNQTGRQDMRTISQEAQDEPSSEPVYVGDAKRYRTELAKWLIPDTYRDLEKEAMARDYMQTTNQFQ